MVKLKICKTRIMRLLEVQTKINCIKIIKEKNLKETKLKTKALRAN